MAFIQDSKSKKFVEQVKTLVNKGVEPTYKAIAEKIGWHNNSLSVTMKGGRNVPFDVYRKFLEVYKLEEENEKKADSEESAYKDKYIALLEQQIKDQTALIAELKDRIDARTLQITSNQDKLAASLAAMVRDQKATLSYAKTLYDSMIEHRAALEGESQKSVKTKLDKLLADHFAQTLETGSR
jgi:hypothetical protein